MHPGGVLGHRAGAGRTLAAAWSATAGTNIGERTRE